MLDPRKMWGSSGRESLERFVLKVLLVFLKFGVLYSVSTSTGALKQYLLLDLLFTQQTVDCIWSQLAYDYLIFQWVRWPWFRKVANYELYFKRLAIKVQALLVQPSDYPVMWDFTFGYSCTYVSGFFSCSLWGWIAQWWVTAVLAVSYCL